MVTSTSARYTGVAAVDTVTMRQGKNSDVTPLLEKSDEKLLLVH